MDCSGAPTPSTEVVEALRRGSANHTWAAAVIGSNNAAGYQLAVELPVFALGGFNGTDPAPTLAGFQRMVADNQVHWFIDGQFPRGGSGSDAAHDIADWVAANFTAIEVDGVSLYDLSA